MQWKQRFRIKPKIWLLSILHAFFMLWLTFFLLSYPYVLPDEFLLVQATSVTKNLVLNLEEKPDTNRFLFINVAWDKVMANKYDPAIPGYAIGKEPITDRAKLVGLLKLLKRNPEYKFVVLDIFFKGETEHDSSLVALINSMPNILASYHRDAQDRPDLPDLALADEHLGLSEFEEAWGMHLKFKIVHNDTIKSTPLLIYEALYDKKFHEGFWFDYLGNKPVLNSFILDYRIRNFDYLQNRYPKVNLGEWLNPAYNILPILDEDIFDEIEVIEETAAPASSETEEALNEENLTEGLEELSEEELLALEADPTLEETTFDSLAVSAEMGEEPLTNWLEEYDLQYIDESYVDLYVDDLVRDKIIFVGDFEDRDIHETIYGDTPGPIILLDAFLALEAGDNVIRVPFLIYLVFFYALISYFTFSYRTVYGAWLQRLTHRARATFLESLTVYLIYFALVSIGSFFLFNIHIGALVLAFYMYLIEKGRSFLGQLQSKRKAGLQEEVRIN